VEDPYHVPVVRSQLTRNLGVLFPDLRDEILRSFEDIIPTHNHGTPVTHADKTYPLIHCFTEWTTLPAFDTATKLVTRVSNRVFVGLPLCSSLLPSRRSTLVLPLLYDSLMKRSEQGLSKTGQPIRTTDHDIGDYH
jgi:hypothetical protein